MTPATAVQTRRSAEERREQVLEAAIREFAEAGYAAASTAAIAKRAGISQPYIYALFPSKQDLFLAVHDRVQGRIRATFRDAVRGAQNPQDALDRMGMSYPALISDRFALLCQLQAYAAAGDPEIRRHVARGFKALADDIARWSGATAEEVALFFAGGMLANVTTALELPEICAPLWEAKAGAAAADA
ncbi:MAG: TetR/AcrR family transcriptional regulator [Candidatus Dormibacteraeota bacterium]|nr:TetR/AcrR family transcriptional regulator [Candidatus Dormibacteraeota bacterium]MBV9526571.1 TetR/AcrR family transcriptional regulator [Candidatus Dormibacteraeota bacterium]